MGKLLPGEQELWRRMSGPDRRHAVRVARDTVADLSSGNGGSGDGGSGDGGSGDGGSGSGGSGSGGSGSGGSGSGGSGSGGSGSGGSGSGGSGSGGPGQNGPVERSVVAAALMHDVGKIQSGLGTWARVAVTVVAMVAGRSRVASWSPSPADPQPAAPRPAAPSGSIGPGSSDSFPDSGNPIGAGPLGAMRAAAGRYVSHDRIGGALLLAAGSDPLTVGWATQHHLPETAWTLDPRTAAALKAADGD